MSLQRRPLRRAENSFFFLAVVGFIAEFRGKE